MNNRFIDEIISTVIFIQTLVKQTNKIGKKVLRDGACFDWRMVVGLLQETGWKVLEWVCVWAGGWGRRVGVGERNIFWGRLVGWKWRAALGIHLERSLDSLSFLEMAVLSGSPGLSHVELGCVTHCFRSREIQSCSGSCPLVCFCVPSLSDVYVS